MKNSWFLVMLVCAALLASACSSDPSSVLSVQDDSVEDGDAAVTEQPSVAMDATDAVAADSAPQVLSVPTALSDLGGSLWRFSTLDETPYDGGEMSFAGPGSGGTDNIYVQFADGCSYGRFSFRVRPEGQLEAFGFSRNPGCVGHPTELFREVPGTRYPPMSATLTGDTLTIAAAERSVTLIYVESGSDANSPPPLPSLPSADVLLPDELDLAKIPEATEIPLPACGTAAAGPVDEALADERLVTANRLEHAFGLPFMTSLSSGDLETRRVSVGLSVRYQPTIDWLFENTPEGHVCLELPPKGFYGETSLRLLQWEVVGTPGPNSTTVEVINQVECGGGVEPLPSEVTLSASSVEIKILYPSTPYGQAVNAACFSPRPITVELGEPLGQREIVAVSR